MTVETQMAIIRQNASSVSGGVNKETCPPLLAPRIADHSLQQMDLNISICSPSSQHMYESDFPVTENIKDPLLSPTSSSICSVSSPLDSFDFDLKPQFEQSQDLLSCFSRGGDLDWAIMCGGDPHMGSSTLGLNMEDIIQVEELDLQQGPTLAQLNSSDSVESPFDECIAELGGEVGEVCKVTPRMPLSSVTTASVSPCFTLTKSPASSTATVSSPIDDTAGTDQADNARPQATLSFAPGLQSTAPAAAGCAPASTKPLVGSSCLQELLLKKEVNDQPAGPKAMLPPTITPEAPKFNIKRPLSPDSDTNTSTGSLDKKWEDIKHFIHEEKDSPLASQGPLLKKIKKEPVDVAYTPPDDVMTKDEPFDSEGEEGSASENEDMDHSDAESEESQNSFLDEYVGNGKKDRRYFWQYNTQAKGPKGKRLCKTVDTEDPHVLNDFEDPVFDPEQNQMRYKHNGKARRGDGNDIHPNPTKLHQLGSELKKLNRMINDMLPVTEMPNPARSKTRKEKNKFASRACRLKKKAQHEANKLKLFGLEQEHRQLMSVLGEIKGYIRKHLENPKVNAGNVSAKLDQLIRSNLTEMIAGNTSDYVNTVLDRVAKGERNGGIDLD